ncbi:hypothetical protein BC830DRAFT_1139591 [Chytriomyces sp. MP71]|nr:hypothetical protein BC830DRAFT_1139591 [Chytriomyces sp. MP71]
MLTRPALSVIVAALASVSSSAMANRPASSSPSPVSPVSPTTASTATGSLPPSPPSSACTSSAASSVPSLSPSASSTVAASSSPSPSPASVPTSSSTTPVQQPSASSTPSSSSGTSTSASPATWTSASTASTPASSGVSSVTSGSVQSACVSNPKSGGVTRCGTDFVDANSKCGTSCPSGNDCECPSGQRCFAYLALAVCSTATGTVSAGNPPPSSSTRSATGTVPAGYSPSATSTSTSTPGNTCSSACKLCGAFVENLPSCGQACLVTIGFTELTDETLTQCCKSYETYVTVFAGCIQTACYDSNDIALVKAQIPLVKTGCLQYLASPPAIAILGAPGQNASPNVVPFNLVPAATCTTTQAQPVNGNGGGYVPPVYSVFANTRNVYYGSGAMVSSIQGAILGGVVFVALWV